MQDCTPVNTPVDVGSKLETTTDEDEHTVSISHWKLNVSHSQYQTGYIISSKKHWSALKHVLHYLKGSTEHSILYNQKSSGECVGY